MTALPLADPDPFRAPLPPGHPLAWGILLAGTSLEGLAWPGWGEAEGPIVRPVGERAACEAAR